MVSYEECAYMWMTWPSGEADRGLSMRWLYDGGSQGGGSEGTRSSGTRSCSSGAPGPFEDGERIVRREELLGEMGKMWWCVRSRFINIYECLLF